MNNTILSILKNARNAKGLTQSEAAVALNVKGNTIGNYENGKTEPDIDAFIKLCEIYDLNYIEVLEEAYGNPKQDFSFNASEIQIIKKYRQLDADGKQRIENQLNFEVEQLNDKESAPSSAQVSWFF